MTLIVVSVLAVAWLGYFALWLRERREVRPAGRAGMLSLDRPLGAATAAGIGEGAKPLPELLEPPRTRQQARRRRRHVAAAMAALAVASLLAVPVLGSGALAVHLPADAGLILFALGSVRRRQAPAAGPAEVRMLYPDRPAPTGAIAVPLGRVVNG